jgi:YjbE family integral membrane protein
VDVVASSALLNGFVADIGDPAFWVAVVQIIWINILLSGDNAVVIAMACRALPRRQRLWGMAIGAGVASVLLIVFTGIVATLMTLPFLKLVGGVALLWVAYNLLLPDTDDQEIEAVGTLWRAIRIVVVADIVMSLDNVIAVAAAARGNYLLLGLGLVISIPVVIAGSALIMAVLSRLPILVWAGAAMLGFIAGGLLATDPVVLSHIPTGPRLAIDALDFNMGLIEFVCSLVGAAAVVVAGLLTLRAQQKPGLDP